jgi:hypothetical protein
MSLGSYQRSAIGYQQKYCGFYAWLGMVSLADR